MTITSLINQKGGVGKTTATINISSYFASFGKKVLVIDFEPQKNTTYTLNGVENSFSCPSLYNVFLGDDINDIIINTQYGVDLIPSNNNLSNLQIELLNAENQHTFLIDSIKKIKKNYDYIFIDCPPTLNIQTINALMSSNKVLIPVTPSNYAIQGLVDIIKSIDQVKQVNKTLDYNVFISRYDARTNKPQKIFAMLLDLLDNRFLKTVIRENIDVEHSQENGMPLIFYNKSCNAALDYKNLSEEILRIWE